MSRQPLTRGQQKPRKVRRRRPGTSWTAMGVVASAVVVGLAGARYLSEQFLTAGYLLILFLCAVVLFQNFDRIHSWGRALLDRVRS